MVSMLFMIQLVQLDYPGYTLCCLGTPGVGRNSIEVLELAEKLKARKVRLVIDNLGIDVTTPAGEMVFTMMAGMAKHIFGYEWTPPEPGDSPNP